MNAENGTDPVIQVKNEEKKLDIALVLVSVRDVRLGLLTKAKKEN
jgi:hypothetical protein